MKVKLPFEPSSLGQVAACAALDDEKHIIDSIKINNVEKLKLESFLNEINIKYIPSATNFLTLNFNSSNIVQQFCSDLLKKGIILRNLESFGLPQCVRATIGTSIENKALIDNIKKLEFLNVHDR